VGDPCWHITSVGDRHPALAITDRRPHGLGAARGGGPPGQTMTLANDNDNNNSGSTALVEVTSAAGAVHKQQQPLTEQTPVVDACALPGRLFCTSRVGRHGMAKAWCTFLNFELSNRVVTKHPRTSLSAVAYRVRQGDSAVTVHVALAATFVLRDVALVTLVCTLACRRDNRRCSTMRIIPLQQTSILRQCALQVGWLACEVATAECFDLRPCDSNHMYLVHLPGMQRHLASHLQPPPIKGMSHLSHTFAPCPARGNHQRRSSTPEHVSNSKLQVKSRDW
jgi:hypothetical protein